MGSVVFAIPLQANLLAYLALQFGVGIFDTGLEVSCNTWILEIWQESSNPYIQGLQFAAAAGRAAALFSIPPFLSHPGAIDYEPSRIIIPYAIISIFLCAVAIILFALYCTGPYVQLDRIAVVEERHISTLEGSLASDGNDASGNSKNKYIMIVVLGCLLSCFGLNNNHLTTFFMPSFAIDIGLGKETGANLAAVYQSSYAVSRLVGAFVAIRVEVKIMLLTCFILLTGGNVLLLMFATTYEPMVWLANVILGMGNACIQGCIFSLMEQMIDVTDVISGFLVFSSSLASIIMTIILGFVMQTSPFLFVYMNIFSIVICLLILFGFYLIDR